MSRKTLNKLLFIHFREQFGNHRLDWLEQGVWNKIHSVSADAALPWQEKILLAFGVLRFQMVSLAIAVVLGLSLSFAVPLGNVTYPDQAVPDMSMFTVHAPYLTANLIERSE